MNNSIVLDRDAVLDMAIAARSRHKSGIELLDAIEMESIRACVCSSDLPAVYEELFDFMSSDAKLYLEALLEAFDVLDVDEAICKQALAMLEDDLATAIVQVCTEKISADYIITSTPAAYKKCKVKAIEAARFLQL